MRNIILYLLVSSQIVIGSGGFDHGTITGKNKLQIDLTLNPCDMIDFGQSYVVIGYGIAETIDVHGYFSHTTSSDQFYYGLMKSLNQTNHFDFSTAVGLRHLEGEVDIFFPQLLYTIKLNKINIGGSIVSVKNLTHNEFSGVTYDVALFFPLEKINRHFLFTEKIEFGLGIFRNLSKEYYPTYSVDIKFIRLTNK